MIQAAFEKPVFRFAPSPNGLLHLGHAYSALVNQQMCRALDGKMLLRIEDIDTVRCNPDLAEAMKEDLHWIGFEWENEPINQSERFDAYFSLLEVLEDQELVYPAFLSRGQIKRIVANYEEETGKNWPCDPDGVPLYPAKDNDLIEAGDNASPALRLDMRKACAFLKNIPTWLEFSVVEDEVSYRDHSHDPTKWGDVVLGRKDVGASYHLACVADDAASGVTHIVRGEDLKQATSVHRVLQELFGFAPPLYHHHGLIRDEDGRKLSKSASDTSLRELRASGATQRDIYRLVGLPDVDL